MLRRRVAGAWRRVAPRDPPRPAAILAGPVIATLSLGQVEPRVQFMYVEHRYLDFLIWVGINTVAIVVLLTAIWVTYNVGYVLLSRTAEDP